MFVRPYRLRYFTYFDQIHIKPVFWDNKGFWARDFFQHFENQPLFLSKPPKIGFFNFYKKRLQLV